MFENESESTTHDMISFDDVSLIQACWLWDWLVGWLAGWFVDMLVGCCFVFGCLFGCLVMVDWFYGRMVECMIDRMIVCMDGLLNDLQTR